MEEKEGKPTESSNNGFWWKVAIGAAVASLSLWWWTRQGSNPPATPRNGGGKKKVASKSKATTAEKIEEAKSLSKQATDLHHNGDNKKALDVINKAIKLNGKEHRYFTNRAVIYMALKKFRECEQDVSHSLKLAGSDATAKMYYIRGRARHCMSKFQEAKEDLVKCMEMDANAAFAKNAKNMLSKLDAKLSPSSSISLEATTRRQLPNRTVIPTTTVSAATATATVVEEELKASPPTQYNVDLDDFDITSLPPVNRQTSESSTLSLEDSALMEEEADQVNSGLGSEVIVNGESETSPNNHSNHSNDNHNNGNGSNSNSNSEVGLGVSSEVIVNKSEALLDNSTIAVDNHKDNKDNKDNKDKDSNDDDNNRELGLGFGSEVIVNGGDVAEAMDNSTDQRNGGVASEVTADAPSQTVVGDSSNKKVGDSKESAEASENNNASLEVSDVKAKDADNLLKAEAVEDVSNHNHNNNSSNNNSNKGDDAAAP